MPASAPVMPAVWAKTTTISATDSPLTPNARNRAVVRLSAPSLRTMSSTPCCHSRTARSASRRNSREARPRSCGALSSSVRPWASERHDASARSAAASACSRSSVSRPLSTATVTRSTCAGLPLTALTNRSRTRPTFDSRERSSSPVPTNSCQRASTSPRSRVPSALASWISATASAYAFSASARSAPVAATCSSRPSATRWARCATLRIAPSSVCFTTAERASALAASDRSQPRMSETAVAGSSPSASTVPSVTMNSGESLRPRLASIRARWAATVSTASGGVRSRTIATAVLRSAACLRKPHGTWSAYRAAEVTNSQRSAAASSWAASVAVALLDRVDVGGVEDRQTGRHRLRGDQLEGGGVAGGAVGALEVGQDPVLAEPVGVVGVVHQDG